MGMETWKHKDVTDAFKMAADFAGTCCVSQVQVLSDVSSHFQLFDPSFLRACHTAMNLGL